MRKVVIVHCWEGDPHYCWYPRVKAELEKFWFTVEVPEMPETNLPKLVLWLPKLAHAVGVPTEMTFLVGHSIGAVTIMRYLESLEEGKRVGGVVFVAGFTDDLGYPELKNFFEQPLDFAKIKQRAGHFVAIHSDDDPFVPMSHGKVFQKELGAEFIVKHGMKHFSGPRDSEESCTSLPEVTESILRMVKQHEVTGDVRKP